jgi:hypothetical protein
MQSNTGDSREVKHMKPILLAVAIVMSLFAAGQANAQSRAGADLQKQCKQEVRVSFAAGGLCRGYIRGLIDAQSVFASDVKHPPSWELVSCIAPDVTNAQTIEVVVKFLDNHPELLHQPAAVLVMQSLHEAFPCPVEKSSSK